MNPRTNSYKRGNPRHIRTSGHQDQRSSVKNMRHGNPRHSREVVASRRFSSGAQRRYSGARQIPNRRSEFAIPNTKKASKKKKLLITFFILFFVLLAALVVYSMMLNKALSINADEDFVTKPTDHGAPFYMLLLGSDSREYSGTSDKVEEQGDNQRSDVMILARVDLKSKQVDLITIPRDTPWYDSSGDLCKINEAYNKGGASQSVKAVEETTGVSISHYADIKISQLEGLVDAIGGVDVTVDQDMTVKDTLTGETIELSAGKQTLSGKEAQAFARTRKTYSGNQDQHRQSNVRQLVEAIAKKIVSGNPAEIPGRVLSAASFVGTDLRSDSLISMVASYGGGDLKMNNWTGPYNGGVESSTNLWLCYQNEAGWRNLIKEVESGGSQEDLDFDSTQVYWQ